MWGAIASVAAPLIGDIIGASEEQEQRASDRNQRDQEQQRNYDMQVEFAKNGIRWKAEDAKAAGLHPLAALGTNTVSFQPSFVGDSGSGGSPWGDVARNLGQNIGRAVAATQTQDERIATQLRLENMQLQNELLKSQITSINKPNNPPLPVGGSANFVPGQGDSGMLVKPSERTASQEGRPAQEAGWRPDVSYSRTDTGLVPVIPQGLSESMEDDTLGKIFWRIRNQVVPNLWGRGKPPASQLPQGASDWEWDRGSQEWRPIYRMRWNKNKRRFE